MTVITTRLFTASMLALVGACSTDAGTEYTLYRSGVDLESKMADDTMRIHIATFDAKEDAKYNQANCDFAQEFFNARQPHYGGGEYAAIKIRYWCEKGRFRK